MRSSDYLEVSMEPTTRERGDVAAVLQVTYHAIAVRRNAVGEDCIAEFAQTLFRVV